MMKRMVVLLAIVLVGCATPYSKGSRQGYQDTQLGENIYRVSFQGNGYTTQERAVDLALLRSAEVTLENGYRYFIIADQGSGHKTALYHSGNITMPVRFPHVSYTIMLLQERPETTSIVYDAQFITKSIKEKYRLR